jgi:AcrR family transcriptional regulator
MPKPSPEGGPPRGRPRDPAVEQKVFAAATIELAEAGFEGFSVRSVARRSGVSRPSLLLRWPTRDALIVETVERLVEWPRPNVDAPFVDELKAIVARIVELMDPTLLGIQLRIVADAPKHPELFAAYQDKVMTKAATRLSTLLARAVADGELPEHIDCRWSADALVGVVFMRSIASRGRQPLPVSAQGRIISVFLTTLRGGGR